MRPIIQSHKSKIMYNATIIKVDETLTYIDADGKELTNQCNEKHWDHIVGNGLNMANYKLNK